MSTNYSQGQMEGGFTHESIVMSKLFCFLLMTPLSCVKSGLKLPMNHPSCKENAQNLYMSKSTCKENRTFLYVSREQIRKSKSYELKSFITHNS